MKDIAQHSHYDYYRVQYERPYEGTRKLVDLMDEKGLMKAGDAALDIACGPGVVTHALAKRFPDARFRGLDYKPDLVALGRHFLERYPMPNLELGVGDWFRLPKEEAGRYRGVLNVHALCCMKDARPAIRALTDLKPEWVLIKSLFFEGPLDVLIHMRDHDTGNRDDDPDADFNIFSLPHVQKIFADEGYPRFEAVPFRLGMTLPRPDGHRRGTHTRVLDGDPYAQFSGPVYLPWFFVLARR